MHPKAVIITLAAALVAALLVGPSAEAKGGYKIAEARLFGGRLGNNSLSVPLALPEGYDEMIERPAPMVDSMSIYQSAGYHIELRYNFEESGYGQRTWLGFWDGDDVLFFSEDMHVGNGTWSAGWYSANPLLAAALRAGIAPGPPATGMGQRSHASGNPASLGVGLLLTGAGAVTVVASGTRRRTLRSKGL